MRKKAGPGEETVALSVSVVPRSFRDEVAGCAGGAVRIRLTAPPVENRANDALIGFLARTLGVSRGNIRIAAGGTGRKKIVRVAGISREEIFRRLGVAPETSFRDESSSGG